MSDILVIGGGIAGTSAAARLSHLGQVTLLERESALAHHASGRSAALFDISYGQPTTVALNRASQEYLETANGGVLSTRGLMVIGSEETAEAFEHDADTMGLERIEIDAARSLFPILAPHIDRAGFEAAAWDIDTDLLLQNFARELRGNGGRIVTGADVTAIARDGKRWAVTAGGETHEAELLVNAAGAWVDEIARLAGVAPLGVTPLRRSMARIPAPGGLDVNGWPMVVGAGETWYCKPDAGALIVSPAEEDPAEPHDAWADDMVLAEGLARYEAAVTEPVTRMLANWAGLRTFSPDRGLVLGRDPAVPEFVWCAGQGGYGFQTSPAASALLADLVAGRRPELDPPIVDGLSPARFT
ncbi:putative FAD-dependent glycerol-3-phosphate dehydrogenase protein [Oceanicola granulosus HTCC2516]|uniref:Putative FAD-dependent glycerol-3-phosphate dehydrogenase protein n=1 Tax=Oceanicola granulosus (strain ATCC BAA-861 / DSM 15982 / KCTC 12143 / HTCC2516) TaxID=314256 RepID=Q2CA81_OCEGH|nr:FAD-dependent oxidoreductase [Oceanicola granulosus]EAR49564.1 putative FAD-dependent glycerol-3-phosphate dehydrogenase protein [Oceanicola granulosus HTCC2516]